MPTRSSSLPIFSIPGANNAASSRALFFIPRSYLSPRIFLSCILATFSLSWLLLYSYSHSSFSSARDSEEWILLEQRLSVSASKTMQRSNSTLTSSFSCHSPTSSLPSIRGPGFNRETICVLQNLCIDAERGAWIHTEKSSGEFPRINVVAADPGSDEYYRPMVLDQFPVSSYRFVDETIFLYGRDPTNRPTWTLNNLMPLHRYDLALGRASMCC
ncbi:hypothetical protein BC939DRAFT_255875 [Gamsiella multidivaricata]|uniref:uncharacterized protein n=1 Tax=Gamsiella multidivaricata TaxID=101098 RepID=UPI002220E322|nr:uncharacterized protein BC939DRAFT_255875 [Gamsiella multidivaricata]KAI7830578.1 hypothetical protein BC939DRAFT_255875 [Gamsiella multidivaricata]